MSLAPLATIPHIMNKDELKEINRQFKQSQKRVERLNEKIFQEKFLQGYLHECIENSKKK